MVPFRLVTCASEAERRRTPWGHATPRAPRRAPPPRGANDNDNNNGGGVGGSVPGRGGSRSRA
eukprot:13708255-Ditylum_brightwellii.AAC.1